MLSRFKEFLIRKWQWVAATIVGLFLLVKLRQAKTHNPQTEEQKIKDETQTRFSEGIDKLSKESVERLQKECERNSLSAEQTEMLKQRLRERYRKHEELEKRTKEMGFKNL